MAFSGPAEDRMLIRELFNSYSDAAVRQDEDAYLACWADDGIRIGQGMEVQGTAALREQWRGIWTRLERMAFFAEIGAIEVDGDTATARCYCREIIVPKGGGVWKVVGAYDDRLVRRGGTWLFARREYRMLIDEGRAAAP